jgi:tRNA(Leu) C34 or U34 (ribose-2'-O)-methylase TrmL
MLAVVLYPPEIPPNTGNLFVRAVLTHREYDRGDWK